MVNLLPDYKFVVVWEFATVHAIEQFLEFGRNVLHSRLQFLEEVTVNNWPERTDVIFAVHQEDIWPFIYKRARFSDMLWIEDALRFHPHYYPDHLNLYRRY